MRDKQIVEIEGAIGALGGFISVVIVLPIMLFGLVFIKVYEWCKGK